MNDNGIAGLFIILVGLVFYFIPAIIAKNRDHHAKNAIAFVNLIAGWTLLGWIACLIWAYSNGDIRNKNSLKEEILTKTPELNIADELTKLVKLKEEGILTEEEFKIQKQKLLNN